MTEKRTLGAVRDLHAMSSQVARAELVLALRCLTPRLAGGGDMPSRTKLSVHIGAGTGTCRTATADCRCCVPRASSILVVDRQARSPQEWTTPTSPTTALLQRRLLLLLLLWLIILRVRVLRRLLWLIILRVLRRLLLLLLRLRLRLPRWSLPSRTSAMRHLPPPTPDVDDEEGVDVHAETFREAAEHLEDLQGRPIRALSIQE
jgi:hypothetical protein